MPWCYSTPLVLHFCLLLEAVLLALRSFPAPHHTATPIRLSPPPRCPEPQIMLAKRTC